MTTRKQESDERLYSLPLEEFVSARDAAARELRKAGDRPEAERVKTLRKPTVAAWAVNQLARRERMKLRALLQAGRQVRDAQAKVVRGGSPEALQQADERFSEVIADMSRTAARLLREDGHPATEATLERVSRTLRAASLDESQTDALERGTLSSDLDPAGFGGLVPVARTTRKAAPPERDKRAERQKREKLEKLGAEVRARRAAVERARASVRAAESELEREQARLAKAEEKLERMR